MDGVTLMANAIRKEIALANEELAKKMTTSGNVADATAQFSNKSHGKTEQKPDTPAKNETKPDTPDETDNTDKSEDNENKDE